MIEKKIRRNKPTSKQGVYKNDLYNCVFIMINFNKGSSSLAPKRVNVCVRTSGAKLIVTQVRMQSVNVFFYFYFFAFVGTSVGENTMNVLLKTSCFKDAYIMSNEL